MRRLFALLLVFILMSCFTATAESIDLSGFSLDELIALRQKIDLLIFASDAYKNVPVPAGDYVVGEDIPAGAYALESEKYASISVYSTASKSYSDRIISHIIDKGEPVGKIELKDGDYVSVEYSTIIFKTYTGLGF